MMSELPEFHKWGKTKRLTDSVMLITQKLDGCNCQILLDGYSQDGDLIWHAGSRKKWLTEKNNNFNFYQFVEEHAEEMFKTLGPGHYYGEFCGPKIQRRVK